MYNKKKIRLIVNIQEDEDGYASHDILNIPVVVTQKGKSNNTEDNSQRNAPVEDNSKSVSLLTAAPGK